MWFQTTTYRKKHVFSIIYGQKQLKMTKCYRKIKYIVILINENKLLARNALSEVYI